jgi:hypothetical protein
MSFEFSTKCEEMVVALLAAEINQRVASGELVDFTEMELKVREGLQRIGRECLGRAVSQQEGRYPVAEIGCPCGANAKYVRRRRAKSITVFGEVWYERAYYVCPACQQGQSPLDRRLGIAPGQISAGLGPLLALLGIQAPFEKSSVRLAQELLLVEVSENSVRKETQLMGQFQTALESQQQASSQAFQGPQTIAQAGGKRPGRIYGGIDGTIVPIRQEWRELKTGTWYGVEPTDDAHTAAVGQQNHLRARQLSYYCDISSAQQFGALVWAKGWARAAYLAEEVVFVCDGAAWIWRLVEALFPRATQIVDWYHAAEYLPPIAHAAFGDTPAGREWLERQRQDLWEGQVEQVISACLDIADQFAKAEKVAFTAATYYENNRQRMDYARLRQEGYQIGSGPTESACKQIAALRLKQAGARWTVSGATLTAKARAAWLSDEWLPLKQRRRALPLAV